MKYSLVYPSKEIPQKAWKNLMQEVAQEAKQKAECANIAVKKAVEKEIEQLKRKHNDKSN